MIEDVHLILLAVGAVVGWWSSKVWYSGPCVSLEKNNRILLKHIQRLEVASREDAVVVNTLMRELESLRRQAQQPKEQ